MSQHEKHATQPPETGGVAAFDIECINLVPEPDLEFNSPDHWSLFCIPVGYKTPSGDIETDVLFRRGSSICDERQLIDDLNAWIRDRRPSRIITYNGDYYDLPILRHRSKVTTRECRGAHTTHSDLDLILDGIEHTDLFKIVKEDAGYNVPLDSALDYHEIPTETTYLDGAEIDGSSMPDLGVRVLSGQATEAEIKAVRKYAESDVRPLFALQSCVSE